MAYSRTVWIDDSLPSLSASNLNNIEGGIVNVDSRVQDLENIIPDYYLSSEVDTEISTAVGNAVDDLSGVTDTTTARTNLDVYSKTEADTLLDTKADSTEIDNLAPKASPVFTGDMDAGDSVQSNVFYGRYGNIPCQSNVAIDCSQGNVFNISLNSNISLLSFNSPPQSGSTYSFILKVIQDSIPRTIGWNTNIKWPNGAEPTLSVGSSKIDIFEFFTHDGGLTWFGFIKGQAMS